MTTIWVPPTTQTDEYARRLRQQAETYGALKEWTAELKQIDPYLEMVRAHEQAEHPLRPGRYYALRHNPGAPPSIWPNEGWTELGSHVFESLKRADMWSDRSERESRKRSETLSKAAESRRNREQEERVDEIMARVKHVASPNILFSPDVRWSNSAEGKRGRG